jgi:hypothetical protein
MPNATVRANARPMPKPKPGSVASIRRQTADLNSATALLKATEVVERELAEPNEQPKIISEHLAKRHAFERAYTGWLIARAAQDNPDLPEDDESARHRDHEYAQAEHELMLMPAISGWMVWHKLEVLALCLEDELRNGTRADSFSLLALAAIKTDLLMLGIGDDEDVMAAFAASIGERRPVQ